MPLTTWNGRFQGVGGGGYVAGISWTALARAVRSGYSTASTDTGHPADQSDGSFALNASDNVNRPAITDFAYRAIHEMTVTGKGVTADFYRSTARYSYFNGCSTGGRQALAEAQRYPHDYDGIAAGAPALYFAHLSAAQLWPQLVMLRAHDFLPRCKLAAFREAVIMKCDALDGVTDGVIGNLADCRSSPLSVVGTSTPCGIITRTDARVMEQIWQGPRATGEAGGSVRFLWYGLEPGSDTRFLAGTSPTGIGSPLYIATAWFQYWLTRNPAFDWRSLTTGTFVQLFTQGVREFDLLATDNPDLTSFRNAGGKIVLWTGMSDPLIPPQGVIRYYNNVVQQMGGQAGTAEFARLFLAPGVGHCGGVGTTAPVPADPLGAVRNWVENRVAPVSIQAITADPDGTVIESRPVCNYPLVARYVGRGSTGEAASFHCARTFS
jgi:feruloyl esterase